MSFDHGRCAAEYPHLPHDHRTPDGHRRCPGTPIPNEDRAQPVAVRRSVLGALRRTKRRLEDAVSAWNVTGIRWDGSADGGVPRRVGEFPENSVTHWAHLAASLHRVAAEALDLARLAEQRAAEVDYWQEGRADRARATQL